MVVGDATAKRTTGSLSKKTDNQSGAGAAGGVKSELSISHILGTSDMGGELLMDLGYVHNISFRSMDIFFTIEKYRSTFSFAESFLLVTDRSSLLAH